METLPKDIQREILLQTDIIDIYHLCQTNKQYSSMCRDNQLWEFKYRQDFGGDNLADDVISKQLGLSPYQAYIRRYTQEDGITYGSELYRSISNLLPRVIISQDIPLTNYYMNHLRNLLTKFKQMKRPKQKIYRFIAWFQVMEAALWIQNLNLAKEFYNIISGDSSQPAVQLYEGAIGRRVKKPTIYHLQGALLMNRLDLADKYQVDQDSRTVAELAISTQNEEWLNKLINSDPKRFDAEDLAYAYLSNGIFLPEIFDILSPGRIITTMVETNIYDLDFFVEALKRFNQDDDKIEDLPCYPQYLSYVEQYKDKLFSEWQLLVRSGQCTPQNYHRIMDEDYPDLDATPHAIRAGNYPLVLDFVADIKPGDKLREYISQALRDGYKDLWYYLVTKYNNGKSVVVKDSIKFDMELLVQEYEANKSEKFITLSEEVFRL